MNFRLIILIVAANQQQPSTGSPVPSSHVERAIRVHCCTMVDILEIIY